MKDLTIIFLGSPQDLKFDGNIDIVYSDGKDITTTVKNAKSKYVTFIRETDRISTNYLKVISEKIKGDFDCCFINYIIDYQIRHQNKILRDPNKLKDNIPYAGDFIWAYIFKRVKLLKILNCKEPNKVNKLVDETFKVKTAIGDTIYIHNPAGGQYIKDFVYVDAKYNEYYKNIIYFKNGCCGTFNGYISWVKHIGRCFAKKYEIVLLYDELTQYNVDEYSRLNIRCVRRREHVNYVCDRLFTSYSDYYYPKNIIAFDSFMFIHGNMSDYADSSHFYNDIYTKYIAVSAIAAKKAKGHVPTKNIEHIINPYKLDPNDVRPHLKLVSAQRSSKIKCLGRIEKVASILDELNIPYTWNVFTDTKENTNQGGLIFRTRTHNPLSYVNDADYFVLLSDSEAMPYSVVEALSLNTKVILTPLEAYDELGVKNNVHGAIIPFEYFEEENKDKLIKVLLKAYKNKDKKINYKVNTKAFDKYNELFKK